MTTTLKIEPLERTAFAPFGDVIEMDGSKNFAINGGATIRYHDIGQIFADPQDGHAAISLARSQPLTSPLSIKMLERHPLASQAFIPQAQTPFIVVVAPAGEPPDRRDIRAFLCDGTQGVNYHPGVWHHSLLALAPDQDFVLIDLITQKHNCDEHHLAPDAQPVLDFTQLLCD